MQNLHVTSVDHAITSRRAVRAFLKTSIPTQIIKDILSIASHAPSGSNAQPWNIYVVTGQTRDQLTSHITQLQQRINQKPILSQHYQETFSYYPEKWQPPYLERRRAMGWGLYGILNIAKNDKEAMAKQQLRNFQFFDAPVGIFFTVKKTMGLGSKMDIAMMVQNVMIAAKARGLDTCPQTAWNQFHYEVLDHLGAPDNEELVCAVALGFADQAHVVNQLTNPRVHVDEFTKFLN